MVPETDRGVGERIPRDFRDRMTARPIGPDAGGPRRFMAPIKRRSPPPRRRSPPLRAQRSPPRRWSPLNSASRRRSRSPRRASRSPSASRARSKSPVPPTSSSLGSGSSNASLGAKSGLAILRPEDRKYVLNSSGQWFSEMQRDYMNIRRRYPHMNISDDFTEALACWTHTIPLDDLKFCFPHVPIYCDYSKEKLIDISETRAQFEDSCYYARTGADSVSVLPVKYNARVVLTSGLNWSVLASDGNAKTVQNQDNTFEVQKQLKFLVAKIDRSELMCIGGPWSSTIDGGNPLETSSLIRTAIRWTKEIASIDLTGCTRWIRFMEIHYQRPRPPFPPAHSMVEASYNGEYHEVTVIFLPDITPLVPASVEEFQKVWNERQKTKKKRNKELRSLQSSETAAAAPTLPISVSNPIETSAEANVPIINEEAPERKENTTNTSPNTQTGTASISNEIRSLTSSSSSSSSNTPIQDPIAGQESTTTSTTLRREAPSLDSSVIDQSSPVNDTSSTFLSSTSLSTEISEKKEKAPESFKNPGIFASSGKPECILLSLSGLLDYNESDKREETFEVSLFAEMFHEMLQRDFGNIILRAVKEYQPQSLMNAAPVIDGTSNEKKRKRENLRPPYLSGNEPNQQQQKTNGVKLKSLDGKEISDALKIEPEESNDVLAMNTKVKEEDKEKNPSIDTQQQQQQQQQQQKSSQEMEIDSVVETASNSFVDAPSTTDATTIVTSEPKVLEEISKLNGDQHESSIVVHDSVMEAEGEIGIDGKVEQKEQQKILKNQEKDKKVVVDEELLNAFAYFDKNRVGYLQSDDLELVIHCLGYCLSKHYVHQLANKVTDSQLFKKVVYKKLTEREIEEPAE